MRNIFNDEKPDCGNSRQYHFNPILHIHTVHCKQKFGGFPSPAGMSLTKLSLAGNNKLIPRPRKVWSKHIQESRNFFLQCMK